MFLYKECHHPHILLGISQKLLLESTSFIFRLTYDEHTQDTAIFYEQQFVNTDSCWQSFLNSCISHTGKGWKWLQGRQIIRCSDHFSKTNRRATRCKLIHHLTFNVTYLLTTQPVYLTDEPAVPSHGIFHFLFLTRGGVDPLTDVVNICSALIGRGGGAGVRE